MTATTEVAAGGDIDRTLSNIQFPNWHSRLFLKPFFERQFIVPEDPPRLLERFLKWYEAKILKVDVTQRRVDRPVFLIGLPRSGTSMLQDILCTHPDLGYITNAMHQFRSCFCAVEVLRKRFRLDAKGERYLGDSVEVEAGSPNDAVGFWADWLKWDAHSLEYVSRRLEDFSAVEVARMQTTICKILWCFGRPDLRFFTKNPGLIPELPLLKDLFPDAKFIHIVRDPRMCANSMRKLYRLEQEQLARIKSRRRHGLYDERPFVPYPRLPKLAQYVAEYGADDVRTTARLWNDAMAFVRDHRQALPSFHEVRFEDVLRRPREEVQRILEFCELAPIASDNSRFFHKIGEVGTVRHRNQYGEFDLIEDLCRAEIQVYGY